MHVKGDKGSIISSVAKAGVGGCFPGGASGKEPAWQCRRPGFDPWVGMIPWRRE